MKVLLCGDSFSADYTVKDKTSQGWPNLLANDVDLTNVSRAGASEYRIWRQIQDNLNESYDCVVVSHTSPYRIYVETHPLHSDDPLHLDCDLIYNDIKDRGLDHIERWFKECFSDKHARDIHQLLMTDIDRMCSNHKVIHIGHLDISAPLNFNFVNFGNIWKLNLGDVNHYNSQGNQLVYQKLRDMLCE
jgi:hypothetical protein